MTIQELVAAGRQNGCSDIHLTVGAPVPCALRRDGALFPAPFSLAEARDALGCSRRCALLLLEHWDASGVTRRQGEGRIFSTSA